MRGMKLTYARLFVDDLDAARAFYRDLLDLAELWNWQDVALGYDVGVTLIIERTDGQHPDEVGRFAGLSLEVDDIDAAHKRLADAGVEFTHPPTRQPWGGTLAHFKDPSGNILTLVEESPAKS
jgi:catechol 2,3-dioxygenase-like lactoylglutathione lyase family enzyme